MAREKAANNKSAKVKAAELLAQMGNQPSPIDEETRKTRLKTLIKLGKERGFLTYAEVNDHLPDDVVDAEQIESIISTFSDMGIQVYDQAPDAEQLLMSDAAAPVAADGVRRLERPQMDAVAWAKRAVALGAGEILLNSMDADGTQQGFDLEMIKAVRKEVKIPIIASGGAGKAADFPPAIEAGADAVLAASIFHYGKVTIGEVKDAIKAAGYTVR